MADDEKVVFQLDLDDADFVKKVLAAKNSLKSLGDPKNTKPAEDSIKRLGKAVGELGDKAGLGEFTSMLAKAGTYAGAAAVAVGAIAASFKLVFEAEDIRSINQQFEILARNAGVAGDALKEALVKGADGLADDTDLLKAANRAIVQLGTNAADIPKTLELAKKITSAFGGELVQNFETLNNAVATGNTRILKQFGLVVDVDKAVKDYAKSHGIAASAVSEHGKQQAILQATLAKGGTALKGIDNSTREATTLWNQFKVTIGQVGEAFTLAFEKLMGPAVKGWLIIMKEAATVTKDFFNRNFGEGAEKAEAQLKQVGSQMRELASTIVEQQKKLSQSQEEGAPEIAIRRQSEYIDSLKRRYEELRNARNEALSQMPEQKGGGVVEGGADTGGEDKAKSLQLNAKFQQDLLALRMQRNQSEIALAESETQLEQADVERRLIIWEQYQAQLEVINTNAELNNDQKQQMRVVQFENYANQIRQIDAQLEQDREKMNANYLKNSKGTLDGIARAAAVASRDAQREIQKGNKMGEESFKRFSQAGTDTIAALGEAAATGQNNAKKVIFKALGDEAIARGQLMLLASAYPPQPPGLIAGAGLIALGGFLHGIGGGGGSSGGGGGGAAAASEGEKSQKQYEDSGASKYGISYDDWKAKEDEKERQRFENSGLLETQAEEKPMVAQQIPQKKSVTLQIQGNYFDTDQSRRTLMEMIREAQDATDFTLNKVGGI